MTTKSAGDESLMVDVQAVHSDIADDESETKAADDVNQSRSSSVLRMFAMPRGSPYTSVASPASISSKYSPMSED